MKKELATSLKKHMRSVMKRHLSTFSPCRPISEGWPLYMSRASLDLSFFVLFVISPKFDWFTVELAWSKHGEYPFELLGGHPDHIEAPENRFRIAELWGANRDELFWCGNEVTLGKLDQDFHEHRYLQKASVEDALEYIPRRVEEAVQKIVQFAVPHFRKVAHAHGQGFNEEV